MDHILKIIDHYVDEDNVLFVEALVDDMVRYRQQTYYEPEQWTSAIVTASYQLADDETFPESEPQQIAFLENLNLEWELIDND